MNFADTVAYFRHLGLELRPGAKFDLARIAALMAELGQPQQAWQSVHIAGTNGKGSVAAMVESALRSAGARTGLYTSPHLRRITERIRIAGEEIAPEAFAAAFTTVHGAIEGFLASGAWPYPPSFFETLTAAGFVAFRDANIEIGVVEVGMGGRLDATNILAPAAAAITALGLDHEKYLGATLAAIAGEKAGIMKPGLAVVTGLQPAEAAAVLRERAAAVGARLVPAAPLLGAPAADADGAFRFRSEYLDEVIEIRLRLPGRHQVENARVALRVCELLARQTGRPGAAAVVAGLEQARWPGRLEKLAAHPPVWADGAHNPLAARALRDFIAAMGWRPVLIYGSLRDKAIGEISELLFPLARHVILTRPESPRALSPSALALQAAPAPVPVEPSENLAAALARARELAGATTPILITGSLYLVGEAQALLEPKQVARGCE